MENLNPWTWYITCSPETFNRLRSDERFLHLLTLARIVNALHFCIRPVIDVKDSDSPNATRQRINSFLFTSSVLWEGFLSIEKMRRYFKSLPSFMNGFAILLRDKGVASLRNRVLKRIRNQFVFHFNRDAAGHGIKDFDLRTYKFASGIGRASGEIYYGLADEVMINFLLQPEAGESDDDLKLRFGNLVDKITKLTKKFIEAAEKLMDEALSEMGWQIENS